LSSADPEIADFDAGADINFDRHEDACSDQLENFEVFQPFHRLTNAFILLENIHS
jgi:hypothetical protein